MYGRVPIRILCAGALAVCWSAVHAQDRQPAAQATAPLVCSSAAGARQVCAGDTSGGVALIRSTGSAACLLGKTWGYDNAGVWVNEGCSGEFR